MAKEDEERVEDVVSHNTDNLQIEQEDRSMKWSRKTRNIAVSSLVFFLLNSASVPAANAQVVALADSTDIHPNVGFYMAACQVAAGGLASLMFNLTYGKVGIGATYGISMGLVIPYFLTMIWVPNAWSLYIAAILQGFGTSTMWCAVPMVIADNSNRHKIQANVGYFFTGVSISVIIGGAFSYFYIGGKDRISKDDRIIIFATGAAVVLTGSIIGCFGITDIKPTTGAEDTGKSRLTLAHYYRWFKRTVKRRSYWMLLVAVLYYAVIVGYFSRILPTAIGAAIDDRKNVFLPAIWIGVANLVGALFLWPQLARLANNRAVVGAVLVLLVAATTISILILPDDTVGNVDTTVPSYITPRPYIITIIAICIGLADSGFNILYYAFLGKVFADDTTMGCSIANFQFDVFSAILMVVMPEISLHVFLYFQQILIVIMSSCFAFGLNKYLY